MPTTYQPPRINLVLAFGCRLVFRMTRKKIGLVGCSPSLIHFPRALEYIVRKLVELHNLSSAFRGNRKAWYFLFLPVRIDWLCHSARPGFLRGPIGVCRFEAGKYKLQFQKLPSQVS